MVAGLDDKAILSHGRVVRMGSILGSSVLA